jgi:hypothetical protein
VHSDTDPQREAQILKEGVGLSDGALRFNGGVDGVDCRCKNGMDSVSRGLNDLPMVGRDGFFEDRIVPGQCGFHLFRMSFPKWCRIHDIGKEKGNCASRQALSR